MFSPPKLPAIIVLNQSSSDFSYQVYEEYVCAGLKIRVRRFLLPDGTDVDTVAGVSLFGPTTTFDKDRTFFPFPLSVWH